MRFVGFNVRKANNRQGPGLFALAPGTLTVVLADEPREGHAHPAGPLPKRTTGPVQRIDFATTRAISSVLFE